MHPARKGSLLILGQALIWGLFPVAPVLFGKTVGPAVTLALSTLFASVFLAMILPWWGGMKGLGSWKVQWYIFIAAILIGGGYYGFYFFGLQRTSPGNWALIGLMEIPVNALFARLWIGERLTKRKIAGILLMVAGTLLVVSWNVGALRTGDLFVFLATLFPPLGNWCMQEARKKASAEAILMVRSLWTIAIACLLVLLAGESFTRGPIVSSLPFLVLNGVIVFALAKTLWIEGIRHISVTEALSLSTTSVFWTLVFGFLIFGIAPTWYQLLAIVPMFFGVRMLTRTSPAPVIARSETTKQSPNDY